MLQDLEYGRLENEYRNDISPDSASAVICFSGNNVLLRMDHLSNCEIPSYSDVYSVLGDPSWHCWNISGLRYIFRLHDVNYFLWMGDGGSVEDQHLSYVSIRQLRERMPNKLCFAVMTAWHLYSWYRNNRFCGRCGGMTLHDDSERMVRCPDCGNMIFPRISPAVIVAVTDRDRLLMSKYAGREYARYALIAGYTEIGETIEQTVHREVLEEVGVRVKNLRYYKSQPWGIDGNVLMGFFCDLDGDDTIRIDERELALAEWHHRDRLPAKDDGYSLTREMIRVFEEGREPK